MPNDQPIPRPRDKRRYAICGLSTRGLYSYLLPLLRERSDTSEVVAIIDIDPARVDACLKAFSIEIPFYHAANGIDSMIEDAKPDTLVVAGPDYTHFDYIIAGLRNHLTVISEKPMVISCDQARKVLDTCAESRGKLLVAHNYRYSALSRKIKETLARGRIGRITNIELVYNLDTFHGSSYFYRWNRQRDQSGGLSVHKCVHHLDLLNWWTDSAPEMVFAFGGQNYYGSNGAHKPEGPSGEPLPMAEVRRRCPYFQKHYASKGISPDERPSPGWDKLNLPMESQYPDDLYIYDAEIDIEDTYSAIIRYQSGASATYSCNFSTPWEGYQLGINGTLGRLEVTHRSDPDPTGLTRNFPENDVIEVIPLFAETERILVPKPEGGHGGADPIIREVLFGNGAEFEPHLGLQADGYAGALAIATGEAMWRSGQELRPFRIEELLGHHYRR